LTNKSAFPLYNGVVLTIDHQVSVIWFFQEGRSAMA